MHIHCAGLAGKVVVPHRLEDIVPREYHAAPRGQEAQQFKLLIRKFHQGAVFPHPLAAGSISRSPQVMTASLLGRPVRRSTAFTRAWSSMMPKGFTT